MQLSGAFITLHTYYPYPTYSSPISRFYFTSLRFYSIFASPFYYCYNTYGFYPFFSSRLCIILLHPFGYFSPYLSVSPFQFPLTLPFCRLLVQLLFSRPPITSFHLISAIFKIFIPIPNHHT